MSELPITQKYYNQTKLISALICAVKDARENKSITDAHFSPIVKGYDISFRKDGKEITIHIKCRKLFDGCVLKMFTDGRKSCKTVVKSKDDISSFMKTV